MSLIDRGVIDQARLIYTELLFYELEDLRYLFRVARDQGVVEDFARVTTVPGSEGRSQSLLTLTYRGCPIQIQFVVNAPRDPYYREEHLSDADLVVIHDPGYGPLARSFDLLGQLLISQRSLPPRPRMVIMEGERVQPHPEATHFPSDFRMSDIDGMYGHCAYEEGVGEVSDCTYRSARLFRLDDPSLIQMSSRYRTAPEISAALYEDQER